MRTRTTAAIDAFNIRILVCVHPDGDETAVHDDADALCVQLVDTVVAVTLPMCRRLRIVIVSLCALDLGDVLTYFQCKDLDSG